MNSTLGLLNWKDALKGLVMAVLSAVLTIVITEIQAGQIDWNKVGTVALITTLSYILKQIGTDSQGNVLGIGSK